MIKITIIHQLFLVKYRVVIILEASGGFSLFSGEKNPMYLLFDCLSHVDDMSVRLLYKCLELFWIIILALVSVL